MDNEKTAQAEQPRQQRLKGIEARLTVVEQRVEKCDRLIDKRFQRLPRSGQQPKEATGEEAA
jgi:hypothetical protein